MEKKHFVTLVMGVVGGLFFALGMCMCLLSEWGMFQMGIGFGIVGAILLLATWLVYRKQAGKEPIKLNAKVIGKILYGIFAAIIFGAGMCLVLVVEDMMLIGILVGIVGIVLLLCLIPMCLGWKESKQQ